jgi:Domain of Unknown Function (DUF928)
MKIPSLKISSLSRRLCFLLPLGLLLFSSVDAALAGGRFPRRVSTPRGLGQPRSGTTVGGGVRSAGDPTKQFCSQSLKDSPNLTALIPASDSVLHTLNPDPLVLVYVPPLPEQSSGIANLTIANAEGDLLSQTTLDMPQDGGLIAFALPTEVLPLVDQTFYQWDLQLACHQQVSLDDPSVSGWIAYQESPDEDPLTGVPAELQTQSALEQIDELSEAGYWLDAVLETANLLNTVDTETRDAEVLPRLEALLKQERLDSFTSYFLN